MKIALLGYGKMGKTIERLAMEAGDEVVLKISEENLADLTPENLKKADVTIEFTRPDSAFDNIRFCAENGVPVVCGTTGWLEKLEDAKAVCQQHGSALFYASNYSVGVNIFFAINRQLARMMQQQLEYNVNLEEIHHTHKLDAPSGTAITLAKAILDENDRKTRWVNGPETTPEELSILSKRLDNVPGTHVVRWDSPVDSIEIQHVAHSREGFAAGALMAAHWVVGKKGFFEMKDLLGF